jgi:metal-responsive CopG/Arc/MetJ family transcriptional regulator
MTSEEPKPPKKKPRVRKAKDHVAVRLEQKLVQEIDAVAEDLTTDWHTANRSDALRMIIIEGLQAYRQKKGPKGSKGQPAPTT